MATEETYTLGNGKIKYHYYRKDSSYVRDALFKAYGGKCFYCSISLEPRHMQVDHILPTNKSEINDEEVKRYIQELEDDRYTYTCFMNYIVLPKCFGSIIGPHHRCKRLNSKPIHYATFAIMKEPLF